MDFMAGLETAYRLSGGYAGVLRGWGSPLALLMSHMTLWDRCRLYVRRRVGRTGIINMGITLETTGCNQIIITR